MSIDTCTKLENCAEDDPMNLYNGCTKCKPNYFHSVVESNI